MLFAIIAAVIILFPLVRLIINAAIYNRSSYKAITHISFFSVFSDKGRLGEYDIYRKLKQYEANGYKFLFNLYLPKPDGKTAEIDALMLGPGGAFVFESKNYSGWIFGTDTQKNWTQTLPAGRGRSTKTHFYNPVMQNKAHCAILKNYLPEGAEIKSIVLFSDRCTLKSVNISDPDTSVANRRDAPYVVASLISGSRPCGFDVSKAYETLYPFTQVSDEVKLAHIAETQNVQNRFYN